MQMRSLEGDEFNALNFRGGKGKRRAFHKHRLRHNEYLFGEQRLFEAFNKIPIVSRKNPLRSRNLLKCNEKPEGSLYSRWQRALGTSRMSRT
jgi:hypothetical protein